MATAFQRNAFQNNAFQIDDDATGGGGGGTGGHGAGHGAGRSRAYEDYLRKKRAELRARRLAAKKRGKEITDAEVETAVLAGAARDLEAAADMVLQHNDDDALAILLLLN